MVKEEPLHLVPVFSPPEDPLRIFVKIEEEEDGTPPSAAASLSTIIASSLPFPEEEEEVVDSMIQTASININPSNPASSKRCSSREKYSPLTWYFKCG